MSTMNLKATVRDLLLLEADSLLEGDRPDATMDFSSRYAVRRSREEAMVAQWWSESLDHAERRVALARALYRRYAASPLRFRLELVPVDVRHWANRQLARAKAAAQAGKTREAELVKVFVHLSIASLVEWGAAHDDTPTLDELVTASFGDARADGEYDGGPAVDDRPVHTVGESYRFRRVA